MSARAASCRQIEPDLVATATHEAPPDAAQRVAEHVRVCAPCRDELARYGEIHRAVGGLRAAPVAADAAARARQALIERLADLRSRVIAYRIFASPLGRLLIARSEHGVSLIEYLDADAGLDASRLRGVVDARLTEGDGEVEALYQDVLDYLAGRRTRLEWPLDFRLARSAFHRRVLDAAAAIPYGAVVSYAGLAREIGQPSATRAVAQALRTNPLPIVVPCHRIIGASGALVGYAGDRVTLKEQLLAAEGVPLAHARASARIDRDVMYFRAGDDREYCLPTCGSIASQTLSAFTLFASRQRAESAGLAPCSSCRPDLHPISR
jgi:methylated-DNA-[protein]-cysteine S-methyltransferase